MSNQRRRKTFDGEEVQPKGGRGLQLFFSTIIFLGQKGRRAIRSVTEGEREWCTRCTCFDGKTVYFFCFLNNSILQLGMVEYLKVRQNCLRI